MDQPKEWEYLQLKGREMEAHIYDPLYVDFSQEGHRLGEGEDEQMKIYDLSRLESSQFRFYSNAIPMETLNGIKPVGQASPLFYRPFLCRLFHPTRELVDERACPVILVQPTAGVELTRVLELLPHISKEVITSSVINAYRALLDNKVRLRRYPDSVRVLADGSVWVSKWKEFDVLELDEGDVFEWQQRCVKLMEALKLDLANMNMMKRE
jgi:hypothetical protein